MITKILGQSSFWMVNKEIAKYLKCNDSALLLSELVDKHDYYEKNSELTKDGYFYYTSEMIEQSINVTYHQQKKCIKNLKDAGFIVTKLNGIPAKLHFKIIENKILNFLNTSIKENQKQDVENFETNNTIRINTIDKKQNNNIVLPKTKNFTNWTLEDFQNSIKKENETSLIRDDLMNFYEYWIEPSANNKFRFQLEKTWSTNLRLKTWERRKNQMFKPISKEQNQKAEMQNAFMGAIQDLMNE